MSQLTCFFEEFFRHGFVSRHFAGLDGHGHERGGGGGRVAVAVTVAVVSAIFSHFLVCVRLFHLPTATPTMPLPARGAT